MLCVWLGWNLKLRLHEINFRPLCPVGLYLLSFMMTHMKHSPFAYVIWGRAPNTYLSKVHILQKRVLRIISHAGFKCHTQPLFCRYKIINIYQINKYLCCMLMYKHKTGMLPHIYNALFIPSITLHTHNTRQYTEYEIEFCQTSTRQNTIAYVGPNMWNNIVVRHNLHNCLSIH